MTQALTNPQPAVVPRPRYVHLRSLLAVACIAILGLTITVVLLATNRNITAPRGTGASLTTSVETA